MIPDYTHGHITQKDFPIIFSRDLDRDVFHCAVQMCSYSQLDTVQEGHFIARQQWMRWDPESVAIQSAQEEVQDQPTSSASESDSSDTELYDIESLMDSQSVSNDNSVDSELPDIDDLRAELTPIAWQTNPPASPPHDLVMPDNYRPATPVYYPTSPAYSPRHSPINIDSDSEKEHVFNPAQNSDGPITTRALDIFDLPSKNSDLENEGEVEIISLVGDYVNTGKLPIQINAVYLFPQPTNMHDLTWDEYPMGPALIIVSCPEAQINPLLSFI